MITFVALRLFQSHKHYSDKIQRCPKITSWKLKVFKLGKGWNERPLINDLFEQELPVMNKCFNDRKHISLHDPLQVLVKTECQAFQ